MGLTREHVEAARSGDGGFSAYSKSFGFRETRGKWLPAHISAKYTYLLDRKRSMQIAL